jgi:hypothetical protein
MIALAIICISDACLARQKMFSQETTSREEIALAKKEVSLAL